MQKRNSNYKFTSREIALYRKERALAESNRVDITNAILIKSRKKNLAMFKSNPQIEEKLDKLNDTIKNKPIESTMKVINYWLEGSKFTS